MVVVIDQNIPGDLQDAYWNALQHETKQKPARYGEVKFAEGIYGVRALSEYVRTRQPHKIPGQSFPSPQTPSLAKQRAMRLFQVCARQFHCQPWSGGAEPSGEGGYSRTWWYSQSLSPGLFYFNYYMQQSLNKLHAEQWPKWFCLKESMDDFNVVDSAYPDQSKKWNNPMRCNATNHYQTGTTREWRCYTRFTLSSYPDDFLSATLFFHLKSGQFIFQTYRPGDIHWCEVPPQGWGFYFVVDDPANSPTYTWNTQPANIVHLDSWNMAWTVPPGGYQSTFVGMAGAVDVTPAIRWARQEEYEKFVILTRCMPTNITDLMAAKWAQSGGGHLHDYRLATMFDCRPLYFTTRKKVG